MMSTPYYNANEVPVIQGTYVESSKGGKSLNHSINEKHISDAVRRKEQFQADNRTSYYTGSDKDGGFKHSSMNVDSGDSSIPRGKLQPTACRDVFWVILFYAHLGGIGCATYLYGPMVVTDLASEYVGDANRYLEEQEDTLMEIDTMMYVLAASGLAGFVISSLAMSLMLAIPTTMIKMALVLNLIVTTAVFGFSIFIGAIGVAIMAGVGLLLTIYYTYVVWKRIPFAASTLVTALTAVKCNMGLAFFACNNLIVTFVWAIWWSTAFVATFYVIGDCNAEGYCENEINGFLVFAFLVSFFWTAQVVKNVVHVTVAGTVGTWWFVPGEAKSCCSPAVRNSYWRSVTTSFGSICFGSLVVAVIQATREMVNSMRSEDNGLLLCLVDCILGLLEQLAEYFNKWAYIYVGLYGYGFIQASQNVIKLFQARGWSSIIADYLIDTVLMMVSICVGIITGIIGALVGSVLMQQGGAALIGAFFVGAAIGFILCSALFSLVSSAVNTVIVCFAEAPTEFKSNHPQLSHQMILAWRDAYPTEFGY
mmetsp:Transcript_17181/g.35284  ORF Transcript_17181/g.35284 Transcript_17181/m.35284 type:complete len:536 (+) Transcript_17181:206-1813(+)